ncbi:hybrid sensor histidine kinase/response regulator, partial [Pseudomonas neuropathica]
PEDAWHLHVDRNQLENAILNLAINARDAMQGEGTIELSAGNIALDARFCAGKGIVPGDYVCVAVADSGVGLSLAVLG